MVAATSASTSSTLPFSSLFSHCTSFAAPSIRMLQSCTSHKPHDKDRLSSFFEEDADLVKRRNDLTRKRDRLSKANAAMANIQVDANLRGGPRAVRLTIALGSAGLGLQLADENDKLVVRGYRDMPDGVVNPGFESGVEVGDVIDQVNGQQASTFQEGINLLKALPASTVATITLLRTKKKS